MRVLCTADYHIANWIDFFQVEEKIRSISEKFDIVVAAGDLFESDFYRRNNPYKLLNTLYPGKKVVATLGNHEFIHQNYEDVFTHLVETRMDDNVHYLDIEGKVEIEDFNIVGNVFWYDDSMACYSFRYDCDFNKKRKSDYSFNPRRMFNYCRAQIALNYDPSKKNILVTHTCPHAKLNRFLYTGEGSNSYSGCSDYLNNLNFSAAVCGHTHNPAHANINGCESVNVGSSKEQFRTRILIVS